jgi:transcriptional regulator with XRE-family HTH domain
MLHPNTEYLLAELTNLRIESGLSQAELARRMEISEQAYRNWEQRTTTPSGDNMVRWAVALSYEFDLHPLERKQRKFL